MGRVEGVLCSVLAAEATLMLCHKRPPACHILECCEGLAQSVISTVGQAFELRFKQYLYSPPKVVVPPERYQPFVLRLGVGPLCPPCSLICKTQIKTAPTSGAAMRIQEPVGIARITVIVVRGSPRFCKGPDSLHFLCCCRQTHRPWSV